MIFDIPVGKIKKKDLLGVYVISLLLDGQKWSTQDILKEIDEKINNNEILTKIPKLTITDPTVSKELKKLREKGIIESETTPRQFGRGPSGYRYWIIENKIVFFEIFEEFLNLSKGHGYVYSELFYELENKLINSDFGKKFITYDLIDTAEKLIGTNFDDAQRKTIFKIIKMSPSALSEMISYPVVLKDLMTYLKLKNEFNDDKEFDDRKKAMLMNFLNDGLIKDVTNANFKPPYSFECHVSIKLCPGKPQHENTSIEFILEKDEITSISRR